jgi:dihydroorotate dehydrogenase electron transfer subunit
MNSLPPTSPIQVGGVVQANLPVSRDLLRLDLKLERPVAFAPGQFAMLNLVGPASFVFSRPFSILAATDRLVSFLYRVVGRGTAAMAALEPGAVMTFLGPLGQPFPEPVASGPVVLVAGGVGLPPLAAWQERLGRVQDLAFFGARDGADVPWSLLPGWRVSVEKPAHAPDGAELFCGLVTELVSTELAAADSPPTMVLACGPMPLLRATAALAETWGSPCWLSLEEHMGCGYGVCKGCVIPVRSPSAGTASWRNATCCQEGPVFSAAQIVWDQLPVSAGEPRKERP